MSMTRRKPAGAGGFLTHAFMETMGLTHAARTEAKS